MKKVTLIFMHRFFVWRILYPWLSDCRGSLQGRGRKLCRSLQECDYYGL